MILSEKDRNYIQTRQHYVKTWKITAIIMIAVLGIFLTWLVFNVPYLANPVLVANQLQAGLIEESIMIVSTLLLPIIVLVLFLIVFIMIAFGFVIFANEKRYLQIIDSLLSNFEK